MENFITGEMVFIVCIAAIFIASFVCDAVVDIAKMKNKVKKHEDNTVDPLLHFKSESITKPVFPSDNTNKH